MSPAERTATRVRPFALLGSEVGLLFRRRRTWAMLAALALVPVLIGVAVRLRPGASSGPPFLTAISENGLFVAFTALTVSVPLFLPLTIGVVAGDTIAGEANLGTLRYLLVAPATRVRVLLVKYAAAAVFAVAAPLTLMLAGMAVGALLFPIRDVTLLSGVTVDAGGFTVRAVLLVLYVALSMLGLSAIGLFLSTLTTVPVGAMAATIVLAAASQILDSLPQLDWLHPWLFSHWWFGFADFLREPLAWGSLQSNAILQLGYVALFGALAYARLSTKDILT